MTAHDRLRTFIDETYGSHFEAAVAIGVSPSTLHYWLRGATPQKKQRKRLAQVSKGKLPVRIWAEETEATKTGT